MSHYYAVAALYTDPAKASASRREMVIELVNHLKSIEFDSKLAEEWLCGTRLDRGALDDWTRTFRLDTLRRRRECEGD